MILAIARNELRLMARDGRLVAIAGALLLLLTVTFTLGAFEVRAAGAERARAAAADERLWAGQGERNPHIAAHFGRYLFKPLTAASFVDPGLGSYVGSAVWIEAHYQNPFRFRRVEEATELIRFGELTGGVVLQLLVPLLVVGAVFGSVAGERESGVLRQLLINGARPAVLLVGKAAAVVAAVGVVVAATVVVAVAPALAVLPGTDLRAELATLASLAGGYGLYLLAVALVALAVSASVRTSRGALSLLLGWWLICGLLVPRLVAEGAAALVPLPAASDFWAEVRRDMDEGSSGHDPRHVRYQALLQETLEEYGVERIEDLPIDFGGLALERGEDYAATVFDEHYGSLWQGMLRREQVQRAASWWSPTLAMRGLSMGLAGTDTAHHLHFAAVAETYRRELQQYLNRDLTLNARGVEFLEYRRGEGFWREAPRFAYTRPRAGELVDLATPVLALTLWVLAAALGLVVAARRLSPL